MKRVLGALAVFAMLAVSVRYAAEMPGEWRRRAGDPPSEFDRFVEEVRASVPEPATVRVVSEAGPLDWRAGALSARLHPRPVVRVGPADWEIELPALRLRRLR